MIPDTFVQTTNGDLCHPVMKADISQDKDIHSFEKIEQVNDTDPKSEFDKYEGIWERVDRPV